MFFHLADSSDASDEIAPSGIEQSEVVYVGAGIGGGIVIIALFAMLILVFVCWRRTRIKIKSWEINIILLLSQVPKLIFSGHKPSIGLQIKICPSILCVSHAIYS